MKRLNITILIGLIAVFMACSSSDGENEEPIILEEIIDPALVGMWSGEASGSFGDALINLNLKGDGMADLEIVEGSSDYCPIPDLRWFVFGSRFKMEGTDECHFSFVEFDAPYSKLNLTGTWGSSSANNGTFTVTKQ